MSLKAILVTDIHSPKPDGAIRLMCISDTHGDHKDIKKEWIVDADILLVAGDFSMLGDPKQVKSFHEFIKTLPVQKRVVVSGNMDLTFDTKNLEHFTPFIRKYNIEGPLDQVKPEFVNDPDIIYLENQSTEVMGLKIYGSPYTPKFGDFGFQTTEETAPEIWAQVPNGTDIVLCHGPPQNMCDVASSGVHCGCPEMKIAIHRVRPALCIFGHIHEAHGYGNIGNTLCCNVSLVNQESKIFTGPTYIDLIHQD